VNKVQEWANENDVTARVSLLPVDQFNQKMIAAIETGTQPDVVINGWPVAIAAERGLLLPLDDIIQKLDPADFFPHKLAQNKVGDHYYSLPMFAELYVAHIRKDVLAAKGLKIPANYDELPEVAKKVSDPKRDFYGLGMALGRCFDAETHFLATLYSFGGGWLSDLSPSGADVFKGPATAKALKWIKDLYEAKAIPPDATGWTDWNNNKDYIEGRVAITMNPPSIYYSLLQTNPELAGKTVLAPIGVTVDGGEESAFVFKSTKHPELAKDLLYYLFKDKEAYRKGIVEGSWTYGLPVFKSQAKAISEQWKSGKYRQWALDPYQVIEKSDRMLNPLAYPYNKACSVADEASTSLLWSDLLSRVIVDKVPIEKAIEETYERIKELIKGKSKS